MGTTTMGRLRNWLVLLAAGIALTAPGAMRAQEKVSVPLSTPGQPATVKARLISGSISVVTGAGREVTVEERNAAPGGRRNRRNETPPPGMHRIDAGNPGLDVEEDHNVVTVRADPLGRADLLITVPANTSVQLRTVNSEQIDVMGLSGDVDVENTNGAIYLKNISGAVVAHTLNGEIVASLDRVAAGKPMSFTSLNGKLDVTLPADTKARLRLKTNHGEVYSDFDVKLEPDGSKPVIEDARNQGGRYRIRMDRGVSGSINGGGPEYLFQTMNGDILIHRK
jgi:hypothetical protein